jgi:hypothetical protein
MRFHGLSTTSTQVAISRISSNTAVEHLDAVLAANSLTINLSKCTFMVPELEVLGNIIN